jgi:hypothetical protein
MYVHNQWEREKYCRKQPLAEEVPERILRISE